MKQRYIELDSLRGLAALSVSLGHFLLIFPWIENANYSNGDFLTQVLVFSPVHIFWAGHEAVILFFVLSGFVLFFQLSSPIATGKEYSLYLIKRIFRIYFPYLIAVLTAIIAKIFFYSGSLVGFSAWANKAWSQPISAELILGHLSLILDFKNNAFDPVLWSLVHEMRISIIFPFLMYFVYKSKFSTVIFISFVMSFLGALLTYVSSHVFAINTDYTLSFHYSAMFMIGAILAKFRVEIIAIYNDIVKIYKFILLFSAVLFYTISWWIFEPVRIIFYKVSYIGDWCVTFGVVIFIIFALASKKCSKFLLWKPFVFLGKISYSYYLYHVIVLLTLSHLFGSGLSKWLIFPIFLVITFYISTLSYYFVELPFINIGKSIASTINNKNKSAPIKSFLTDN